jgi:hypothetical protein
MVMKFLYVGWDQQLDEEGEKEPVQIPLWVSMNKNGEELQRRLKQQRKVCFPSLFEFRELREFCDFCEFCFLI